MLEVITGELNGVPTFWAEGPAPAAAGLVFGVGQAHETLASRGCTHLVEHLALAGIGEQHVPFNGCVELGMTSFLTLGSADEVAAFVSGVARSLAVLPLERLAREIRILDTEASTKDGGGLLGILLDLRYGTAGFGLTNYEEFGLKRVTAAEIELWRDRYFGRGNAALWASGPTPPAFDLELPPGEAQPHPEARAMEQELPAWFPYRPNGVAVGFVGPRTPSFPVAVEVLEQRLLARLRVEEGRSYGVHSAVELLTPDLLHGLVVADCLPEEAGAVRDAMLAEMSRLSMSGHSPEELQKLVNRARRTSVEQAAAGLASSAARDWLFGGQVRTPTEVVDAIEQVAPDAVATVVADAFQNAIWLVPGHLGMDDRRINEVAGWSPSRANGKEYLPAGEVPSDERLVVDGDAVSLVVDAERQLTVAFSECQAVQRWEDGARTLWGPTGLRLHVHPDAWREGRRAVTAIDHGTPQHVVVPMGRPAGPPAVREPAPAPVEADEPSVRPAERPGVSGRALLRWVVLVALVALAVAAIVGIFNPPEGEESDPAGGIGAAILFGGLAVIPARRLWRDRRR